MPEEAVAMMPFLMLITSLIGCPFGSCGGGSKDFVVVVEGKPEPDSAWITLGEAEQEMSCTYVDSWDETHCSYPLESEDDVTAAAVIIDSVRIELDPESAYYEGGAECGMGGWYFLYYAHPCVESYELPFCEEETLPIAGEGCFQPCEEGADYCETGSCVEAWVGCETEEDCDVCGVRDWVCLSQ